MFLHEEKAFCWNIFIHFTNHRHDVIASRVSHFVVVGFVVAAAARSRLPLPVLVLAKITSDAFHLRTLTGPAPGLFTPVWPVIGILRCFNAHAAAYLVLKTVNAFSLVWPWIRGVHPPANFLKICKGINWHWIFLLLCINDRLRSFWIRFYITVLRISSFFKLEYSFYKTTNG